MPTRGRNRPEKPFRFIAALPPDAYVFAFAGPARAPESDAARLPESAFYPALPRLGDGGGGSGCLRRTRVTGVNEKTLAADAGGFY